MCISFCIFFFKQKTAYEMRISDWSSDVCSSDLWHGVTTYGIGRLDRSIRRSNYKLPDALEGCAVASETIAIASDHAGVGLKSELKETLSEMSYDVLDLGTNGTDSVDYPDFAQSVADALAEGRARRAVLICGTGLGMPVAAHRPRPN